MVEGILAELALAQQLQPAGVEFALQLQKEFEGPGCEQAGLLLTDRPEHLEALHLDGGAHLLGSRI